MKQVHFQDIVILLVCLAALACGQKKPVKNKEQIMQEKLEEKLANWRAELEENCRERVLDSAIVIVDSTLIANARLNRESETPPLPARPGKPNIVLPEDTTPVAPVLPDSLR